jgi:nondiscriminating aspartyl-tRNA synthetase
MRGPGPSLPAGKGLDIIWACLYLAVYHGRGAFMRERVLIRDLKKHIGNDVTIGGWVHSIRKQGKIVFVLIRDRTGVAQVVCNPEMIRERDLRNESVLFTTGTVIEDERADGGVELILKSEQVLSNPKKRLPILVNEKADYQKLELETLLNHRVLSLRNPKRNLIFRLQADIIDTFRTYLRSEGFTEVTTPKIIATGTEGGTQLFTVDYFDRLSYLAQSPQFYKQMLVGAGYERVFEIGHVYRAEIHNTSRHLNEYVSLDYEMGFIENEHDVMDVEERLIIGLFERLNKDHHATLELFGQRLPVPKKIPRIPIREACSILQDAYGKKQRGYDLDPEGEKLICEWAKENFDTELLFLIEYPLSKRPVYTMPLDHDPTFTRSFDLLFRGLEITTGGQRIHDYQMLVDAFESRGLKSSDFDYYIDTFAYGMPPHGGLAIGLERITQQTLGLLNVREASIFPRDRSRIVP